MNAKLMTAAALGFAAGLAQADYDYDFGADLRVREELMQNVPWLPGGGTISSSAPRSKFRNHMRFRPDVWGEFRGTTENWGSWRLFAKLTDEFRWNIEGVNNPNANSFPNEVIPDNLFVEGLGLFDGLLDLTVGRQNIYNYCGLDHIFIDGTPGDGSRTLYSDMARAGKNAVVAKLAADDVTFFPLLAAEATKAMEADVAKAMKVFGGFDDICRS